MKHVIQLTLLLLTLSVTSWTADPSADVKAAVLKAEADWKAAVLKADPAALDRLLATNLTYTSYNSKPQSKEEFIGEVTTGTTVYKAIDFKRAKLRQYGTVVVITHSAMITTVPTGTVHVYLTEVWDQQGEQWQMISFRSTSVLPPGVLY